MKNAPVWLTLPLPDGAVEVVLTRRERKSIGIAIRDGRVELIAHPRVGREQLLAVLHQRQHWIAGHVARQRHTLQTRDDWSQVQLFGQPLPLHFIAGQRVRVARAEPGVLVSGVTPQDRDALQNAMSRWLKQQAHAHFPGRLAELAQRCTRAPASLALSSARTRWGSCTSAGVIRLNWRLVQAPPDILDYVVAHELAHLVHMNHSAAFWSETARLFPDWQRARLWLKQHGSTLFRFG